jgi:broad specificity phosphatase PhoE
LILIRHSTPAIDVAVPSTAWALSLEGARVAAELAEAVSGFKAHAVVTSPELKARQTAAIISDRLVVPRIIDDDLREHERTSNGFLPRSEFAEGISRLLSSPGELVFGDETADSVFVRFSSALERALARRPQHDVLAVTHGTAISIYIGRKFGLDPMAFWRRLTTPMAVIISDESMEIVTPPGASAR